MTECATTGLELGTEPEQLTVKVVPGSAWGASLELIEYDPDDDTETVIAWHEAPVLEFAPDGAEPFDVTATLSTADSVADALAAWSMTAEQVDLLSSNDPVRLTVNGEAWAMGTVLCLY